MVLGNNNDGVSITSNTDPASTGGWLQTYARGVWSHMGGWVGVGAAVLSALVTAWAINRFGR